MEGLAPVLSPIVKVIKMGGALAREMDEKQYLSLKKAYLQIEMNKEDQEAGGCATIR